MSPLNKMRQDAGPASPHPSMHKTFSEKRGLHLFLVGMVALLSVFGTLYFKSFEQVAPQESEAFIILQCMVVNQIIENVYDRQLGFPEIMERYNESPEIPHGHPPTFRLAMGYLLYHDWIRPLNLYRVNLFGIFVTVFFVYLIGRRMFSSLAGLYAALFCALCTPIINYSRQVMIESLMIPLAVIAAWVVLVLQPRRNIFSYALIGLAFGLGVYLKQFFFLFPLGILFVGVFRDFFTETDVPRGPSVFGKMLNWPALGVALIPVIFIAVGMAGAQSGFGYFLQAINVCLTAMILVFLFDFAYRHSRHGDKSKWAIAYILFFAGYAFYPLAMRPQIYGDQLCARSGIVGNLLNDQVVLTVMVVLFYLVHFLRSHDAPVGIRGIGKGAVSLLQEIFINRVIHKHSRTTPALLMLLLVFGALVVPLLLFVQNPRLVKGAIAHQTELAFGFQGFLVYLLVLFLPIYQVIMLWVGARKMEWRETDFTVLVWFLLPPFVLIFIIGQADAKYLIPAMPALAVLVGRIIENLEIGYPGRRIRELFVLACLIPFLVVNAPVFFGHWPMRIVSLPMEQLRISSEINVFSKSVPAIEIASRVAEIASTKGLMHKYMIDIDESVQQESKITANLINILLMEKLRNFEQWAFEEDFSKMGEADFFLVREGAKKGEAFYQNIADNQNLQEVARFTVPVTRSYALFLSFIENRAFHLKEFANPVYILYQRSAF